MRAVAMLLRAQLRQHWKSWLALVALVTLVGGLVMAAVVTARRTAAAFPGFLARHGYDAVVYSSHPLPSLARIPQVAHVTSAPGPITVGARCSSCRKPIDLGSFGVFEAPPADLGRMVKLLSGRMPDQSRPDETLASYTLARDNGVRIGSVIQVLTPTPAQVRAVQELGPSKISLAAVPRHSLRVVGLVVAENEFPAGNGPRYDLFPTKAYAAAVNHNALMVPVYYVRLRHGTADQPAFDNQLRPLHALGADDLDIDAAAVQRAIWPQAVGWWVLAGLTALAGLAVIGQAASRQFVTDQDDHAALSAMGVRTGQFVTLGLARAAIIGAAGAAGAVALAAALSPLTPVGEARLATSSPGGVVIDPLVTAASALATAAVVVALSAWPAVRYARRPGPDPPRRSAPAPLVRALAGAGAPPSAVIGVRHALERGRGRRPVPVGTALLGTVMAVAALSATAVFGASLTRLITSPALYGAPFQVEFTNQGTGSGAVLTGALLTSLRRDPAISRITLVTVAEIEVNGQHVRSLAVNAVRGPALISAVDGRLPRRDRDIVLGAATMRAIGTRPGGMVRVTVPDPVTGAAHTARFRVVGRASFLSTFGTGGLGNGAAMTVGALAAVQCPPGGGQPACRDHARRGVMYSVLARSVPGPAGAAALARYTSRYRPYVAIPLEPVELVNFGQSVSFPLLFGVALSLFAAATMVHLLLVSVNRRRTEAGVLKVLGFLRRQVAAIVGWQATVVALIGIVAGVPLGIAAGKIAWRLFATNFGVVPVPVVPAAVLAVLACGVLVAANALAAAPAWLAARSRPAQLLRAE
ncbi:MAG TPA: ABC transporter permease [Streptosporangiaceae bacterium]|nr:ABC transporter permease [Streptosporangiaceae bacterium]